MAGSSVIPVRCMDCARVRFHTPGPGVWTDHPARLAGEVAVMCATCVELRRRLARAKEAAMDRQLLRDRARGYGPAPEGEDVFRGFREGE